MNQREDQLEKKNQQEERQHNHQLQDKTGEQEQMNYYNQYCRLHLANVILTTQLKELTFDKTQLISKLIKLQKRAEQLSDGNSGQVDQKKRRVRRAASQIARHYKCQIEGCSKSYGSQGSLNQHIKIKHPQIFKAMGNHFSSGNGTVKESSQEDSL